MVIVYIYGQCTVYKIQLKCGMLKLCNSDHICIITIFGKDALLCHFYYKKAHNLSRSLVYESTFCDDHGSTSFSFWDATTLKWLADK